MLPPDCSCTILLCYLRNTKVDRDKKTHAHTGSTGEDKRSINVNSKTRLFENLVQPVEQNLAYQAAVLHDAVICRAFDSRRDDHFLHGVGEIVHADLLLPFNLLALVLTLADDDQSRNGNFGRVKGKPLIGLCEPGRLVHRHAPAPANRLDDVAVKGCPGSDFLF